MAWRKSSPQLIALFDSVVARDARVERRQMFGYPAAFAGGKLFASLHQESFILKLAPQDCERLKAELGARPFEPMPGRQMREFVVLPQGVLSDRSTLDRWLSRSLAYVAGLPGKKPRQGAAARRKRRAG
jgi:TfoX/Sxy family transcriptional regulator of competence genes